MKNIEQIKGTKIFRMRESAEDSALVKEAASIIEQGGLVAFPTETVYGLGGKASSLEAVAKIFQVKGRSADKPLIIHVSSINQARYFTKDLNQTALSLMEKFWPGPLTIILPKNERVNSLVSAEGETVALRMPANRLALLLIEYSSPLAAPSANLSDCTPPTSAEEVIQSFAGKIDGIIDGGHTTVKTPSTIVDLTTAVPILRRRGVVSPESILRVTKELLTENLPND